MCFGGLLSVGSRFVYARGVGFVSYDWLGVYVWLW